MNESLSLNERKNLIRGFEDGINELFGGLVAKSQKFLNSMGNKAKETYNDMINKGKSFYEKGKQLAGDAWQAIQDFSDKLVTKVQSAYNKASELIVSNYNQFKQIMTDSYHEAIQEITEMYEFTKDKSKAFAEAVKGIWTSLLEKTALLIQSTKEKLISTKDSINKWIQENKNELIRMSEEAKRSSIDSLNKLGDQIKQIVEKTTQTAKEIGYLSVFVCVYPIIKLAQGIKAIPGVYEDAIEMVKDFVAKEVAEYREEMAKESFKHLMTFEKFKY